MESVVTTEKVGTIAMLLQTLLRRLDGSDSHYPVAGVRLAAYLGVNERTVRELVGELIDRGELIGSNQRGYFRIRDMAELEEGTRHLVSRARSLFRRVSKLRHAAETRFGPEVLTLFDLEEVAST